MLIVIPMAGFASRFRKEGYTIPKYALRLPDNTTVFDRAVGSFVKYFDTADFVFVTRGEGTAFAEEHAKALGIESFRTVEEPDPRGFGSSAINGLLGADVSLGQPAIIHVVDTFLPHFELPDNTKDSFMEFCLSSRNPGQSSALFVKEPPQGNSVAVSPVLLPWLRHTGLYFFPDASRFVRSFQIAQHRQQAIERTSGLSSPALRENLQWALALREMASDTRLGLRLVNRKDVVFCGVPKEYEALQS